MQNKNSKLHTILLIILIILVGVAIWKFSTRQVVYVPEIPKEDPTPINEPDPVRPPTYRQTVALGEEFRIKLGEQVIIADSYGATFKLTGFYNHPCPPNALCLWSGLDVFYEIQTPTIKNPDGSIQQQGRLYVKNQPLQHIDNAPFSVIVRDSDYTTYATIVLEIQGQGN